MASAKLTSKGQITLPKSVREALELHTGDRVAFRILRNGTAVVEPASRSLMSLAGSVKSRVKGVSVEDMEEAVRAGARRGRRRK